MDQRFLTRGVVSDSEAPLREIYTALRLDYCGSLGIEYTRIGNEEEREWLRDYVERRLPAIKFDPEIKRNILEKLTAADGLEKYLDVDIPVKNVFLLKDQIV